MNHINVQDKSPSEARLQKIHFNPTSLTLIKTERKKKIMILPNIQ